MVNDGQRHVVFMVNATGTVLLAVLGLALTEAGLVESGELALTLTLVWGLMTFLYMGPIHDAIDGWIKRRYGAEVKHE